jgi:hypothetical protein
MATKENLKEIRSAAITTQEKRVREMPGGSNAGEYDRVKPEDFAGNACGIPGTYPINTIERARAALAYAHNAKNPNCIRREVYKKWPSLDPDNK